MKTITRSFLSKSAASAAGAFAAVGNPTALQADEAPNRSRAALADIVSTEGAGSWSNSRKMGVSELRRAVTVSVGDAWTKENEKRFEELEDRFVEETITSQEEVELEMLQDMRDAGLVQRTYDEVAAELRRKEAATRALSALNQILRDIETREFKT